MGTSLTGLTPATTFDALIKVGDNGPLSGTAKVLSDGLGNDSVLALSTTAVGIGTTTPTGKLTVSSGAAGGGYNSDYDELVLSNSGRVGINILSGATEFGAIIMGGKANNTTGGIYHNASTNMLSLATEDTFRLNIDNAGNVGIGTTTPNIYATGGATNVVGVQAVGTNAGAILAIAGTGTGFSGVDIGNQTIRRAFLGTLNGSDFVIYTNPTNTGTNVTERMRITSAGDVGIGTSAPTQNLSVEENTLNPSLISLTGSFGTARGVVISLAADETATNESALKFTTQTVSPNGGYVFSNQGGELLRVMSSGGITFNGDTAAANALDDYEEGTFTASLKGSTTDPTTAVTTTGTYTKIGRQVSVSIQFANVNTTGAAGAVTITGIPFACATAGLGAVITEIFTFGATRTSVSSLLDSLAATTIRLFVSGNDTGFEGLTHNAGAGRYLYTSLTYFV